MVSFPGHEETAWDHPELNAIVVSGGDVAALACRRVECLSVKKCWYSKKKKTYQMRLEHLLSLSGATVGCYVAMVESPFCGHWVVMMVTVR